MNSHEIAQNIVNLKGDLLRIGPSDNAGRESLYIINEGILERWEASLLDNEIQQIAGKTSDYIYNNVFRNIKSKLLAQQQSDGIQRKIKDLLSYYTRTACLFEGGDILNIKRDDSGGQKLELTTLDKYLAEGGAPFHERLTFALDTQLFSSAVAFGSDEDELKRAVECFCPEWHRFLKTSLVSYEYDCIPLLELVGNFLLPINSTMRRGFWFLVGQSKSGKTTLLDLLSELVERKNVGKFHPGRRYIYEKKRRAVGTSKYNKINKYIENYIYLSEGTMTIQTTFRYFTNIPFCCAVESRRPPTIKSRLGWGLIENLNTRLITLIFERDESTPIDCDLPDKLKKEAPALCALAMARLAYLLESKQPFTPTCAKRFPRVKRYIY